MVLTVGLRAHMGWADAVTLTGVPSAPRVVDRRTIDIRPEGRDAHPYGAARDAPPDEREWVLQQAMEALELSATDALAELTSELDIAAGGIVVSRDVLLRIPLERVLASTALFHTASGAAYQRALRFAFDNLGLPVTTISFDDAQEHDAWARVGALGQQVGPPWRKDHKFAATAAWAAALSLEAG